MLCRQKVFAVAQFDGTHLSAPIRRYVPHEPSFVRKLWISFASRNILRCSILVSSCNSCSSYSLA